ncbi:FMN reductase (NADPH) [Halolactibacillus alkaliphilus]|uniref:FMN reductase (NADPH) n=1 Tax=Halolactibacillus alkaliphilus TaxID=442899 RepID=A0A511X3K3_9BACI|nr:oxygen-insensitive NADPH nitroreductase [Halolactibacillus alkaliphilus]GEN57529.1 FMN reductase (NADPH) [Halolactibacillus alkaliphilus]GGN73632.1 FMN reductase (NADPH) [Halolactibacillus alkaliphilus]SFO97802.1 FMN reductase (NADPH) [Halolactibacillus alkaliphilus]
MNSTIDTILSHRSIRKFKSEPLKQAQLDIIIDAARASSTSSYLMAYTMIGVTDPDKKRALASISNQSYIEENGHFILFCGDYHRHMLYASDKEKAVMAQNVQSTEYFMIATVDATIAAQNMTIAAESLGIGVCYIGSIKRDLDLVNDLFDLPEHVVPLFGLALGYPDEQQEIKPKLPKDAVYFENSYKDDPSHKDVLAQFDQTIEAYYRTRSTNKRTDSWTNQMIKTLHNERNNRLTPYVKEKKFNNR